MFCAFNSSLSLPESSRVSASTIVPTVYCATTLARTYMAVIWSVVVASTVIGIIIMSQLRVSSSRCNRPEFPPSQFFPRGKNGPAHSFPGEKVGRPILSPPSQFPPPSNFKNHNGIIISLHKFKKPLLN